MEDKICLDTDFLVNFLRDKKEEKEYILACGSGIAFATTFINLFELYYGAYKSGNVQNLLQVEELQHRLRILNLSKSAVKHAGETIAELEKKGEMIDFRDLLIGCVAESEGYCIKTNNAKHFAKIKGLVVR